MKDKRKLDPTKIWAFIGKIFTGLTVYAIVEIAIVQIGLCILENCITVYR